MSYGNGWGLIHPAGITVWLYGRPTQSTFYGIHFFFAAPGSHQGVAALVYTWGYLGGIIFFSFSMKWHSGKKEAQRMQLTRWRDVRWRAGPTASCCCPLQFQVRGIIVNNLPLNMILYVIYKMLYNSFFLCGLIIILGQSLLDFPSRYYNAFPRPTEYIVSSYSI